jgi:hypothetical protein
MKKIIAALALSLLSLSAWADAPAAAPADAEKGEKAIALMEKMADIVGAKDVKCDTRAENLSKFMDDNAAALKQSKEEGSKMTPEQKRAFMEKYSARFKAATAKLQAGFMECKDNPKFVEVMKKK